MQKDMTPRQDREVILGDLRIANNLPLVVFGGMNVIESRDLAMEVAQAFVTVTQKLSMPFVFKASFDKANRSSIFSFRGLGMETALSILEDIKRDFGCHVMTDVHEIDQVTAAAEVCDVLQLPAFLARQTDLVRALAESGAVINVKKPQFLSPSQMGNVIEKFREFGNERLIICERGTCFGYDNLVVDMLGFSTIKEVSEGLPVIFDVTHSLQCRDGRSEVSGGRRGGVVELARSGVAVGLAGLFLEAHPDPDSAECDGPSALPLNLLYPFLEQVRKIDNLVKNMDVFTVY